MFSLVIQAGGQSARMGEDKALKLFLGRPLIQRVIDRLAPIADEILVTTNCPDDYAFLTDFKVSRLWRDAIENREIFESEGADSESKVFAEHPGRARLWNLRLIPDLVAGRGALGGLYTALASAASPIVAVVACDMPFASASLLEAATRLLVQEEADVVIPKTDEGYEPFHAVYRRAACVPAIQSALESNLWKVIAWFPSVKVRELTMGEVTRLDPSGLAFWNVNTPEEFAEAERLAD